MCRNCNSLWVATILGVATLGTVHDGYAEKTLTTRNAVEWKKKAKFEPSNDLTIKTCPGTTVNIAANSLAEVRGKIPLPTAITGLTPYADAAQLLRGRIDVTVNPKLGTTNALLLYGPRRTSVLISGGRAAIVVTDKGLAVGLYEGKDAAVGIGATWKHIASGEMIVVSAEHPEGFESPLPPVPTQVAVSRPVIAVSGMSDPSRASWQPVANITSYRVSIRDLATDQRRVTDANQAALTLEDLKPGRYELRVSALAEFGLDGAYSEPAFVNVVGVELPPGGYFAGGKAYIEPGQHIKLTHVDGLEMTYDGASVYFSAVARTGLRNGQASTFHLRLPGATERASLEVAPRSLQTKIELLPTLARWPRDKIKIVIILPKTIAQSTNVELKPSVTVNNKPIELDWLRTENTLESAILGPPIYPGPWVLRASVTDQHGYLLGHNFIEIASMAGENQDDLPVEVHRGTTTVQVAR
jgi:hypothetical protein